MTLAQEATAASIEALDAFHWLDRLRQELPAGRLTSSVVIADTKPVRSPLITPGEPATVLRENGTGDDFEERMFWFS
jgi:hypothetical protein